MKHKDTSSKPVDVYIHGEAMIFQSTLPKGAKKFTPRTPGYLIIADSETTGNHHVVDEAEGVEFYMDENGQMFMSNTSESTVRCVHENRHDAITIPPGCWEFGLQQEVDHLTKHQRNVKD